jgi:hypothetical protein
VERTIKEFKIFTIVDFEKEERYLTQMSKKGYRFKKVSFPGFYSFERVEPEDYVYRLTFKSSWDSDYDNYIALFQDSGWEYIQEFMGWSYFRKKSDEKNTEIFSDNESKVEEIDKIFKSRYIPLFVIFSLLVLPNAMRVFSSGFHRLRSLHEYFLFLFIAILYTLYVFLITYCGLGIYKLRSKYLVK